MLAMAQATVPMELKQRLELIPSSVTPLEHGLIDRTAEPTVKFLTFPNGLLTSFEAIFFEREVNIKKIHGSSILYNYRFPIGIDILFVDFLQTKDSELGLFVTYREGEECFAARLIVEDEMLRLVNIFFIPYMASCAKVVVDDMEMTSIVNSLAKPMQKWINIVVVGTVYGHAYVFSIPVNKQWKIEDKPVEKTLTDALVSNHKEKDRNGKSRKFVYRDCIQGRETVKLTEEVRVTSVGYISRSCDLLIGLSFGGIVQVGFTPAADIIYNFYQNSAPVWKIVPMLPHDDPNMNVWFWALYGEEEKGVAMVLYEGSYRVVGQENVPLRDREFVKPMFMPRMVDQLVGKGSPCKWIAAHTLARERRNESFDEDRMEEISTHHTTLNDTNIDTSQFFYSYKDGNGEMKFGVFDLNTYYYKRLQDRPIPDNTAAKQCPYLTNVIGKLSGDLGTITDIVVDCAHITKFQFMADDPEQQIYVSGLNLPKIYFGASKSSATAQLLSLPLQVADRVYSNLSSYIKHPKDAVSQLITVGLMPSPMLGERNRDLDTLLTAAVIYGHTSAVVKVIASTKESEWSLLNKIGEWIWSEGQRARNKLDTLNDILFSDTAKILSVDQKRLSAQVNLILKAALQIFRAINQQFQSWERQEIVPHAVVVENEARLSAVSNLWDYANCIRNLYVLKYLPLGERNGKERQILEEQVDIRRRSARAQVPGKSLYVDDLITKMQELSPDEAFWMDLNSTNWYPPALLNGVAPLLVMTYPDRLKQNFIVYYVIDLVMAKKKLLSSNDVIDTELPFYVSQILDDVAKITKKEVIRVFNIWRGEQEGAKVEMEVSPTRRAFDDLEVKLNRLMDKQREMSTEEEKEMKDLCKKLPYGQFRYQLYLLERSRFSEMEILPLPSKIDNQYIEAYSRILPALREIKKNIRSFNSIKTSQPFLALFKKSETTEPISQVKLTAPKTPVPLHKRIKKPASGGMEEKELIQESIVTPERIQPMEEDVTITTPTTPVINTLDERTKKRINVILRTPTSKRVKAAAAAEGQTGVMVTPEREPALPVPTSILKTPIRKITTMSPSRGRLRWDPEFVIPSVDTTPQLTPSRFEKSSSPVEAASIEEQSDGDDATNFTEVEDEPPTPIEESVVVLENQEPAIEEKVEVEIEEKSFEVQEEEEVQKEKENEPEEQAVEVQEEQVIEMQEKEEESSPFRLVDYTMSDTSMTINTTAHISQLLSRKWVGNDGVEHSFEEQPSDEEIENELVVEPSKQPTSVSPIKHKETEKTLETPAVQVEQQEEKEKDEEINIQKYKRKERIPRKAKMSSEEPDPVKPRKLRRSMSDSEEPEQAERRRSTRLSPARFTNNNSNTIGNARRALFATKKEESINTTRRRTPSRNVEQEEEVEQSNSLGRGRENTMETTKLNRRSRSRTTSITAPEPKAGSKSPTKGESCIEEPASLGRRSRSRATSSNAPEPTIERKSPSRRVRKLSEATSPSRRSRSRTNSISVPEPVVVPKSPSRRSRTPLETIEPTKEPARRSSSRNRPSTDVPLVEQSETTRTRRTISSNVHPIEPPKSPARARSTSTSDAVEKKSPARGRGRPSKATAPSIESVFKDNLAKAKRGRPVKPKETDEPLLKRGAGVPATIEEEPEGSASVSRPKRSVGRPPKDPVQVQTELKTPTRTRRD